MSLAVAELRTQPGGKAPDPPRHVRSPVDAIRAATGALVVVVGLALANGFDSTMLGFSQDTVAATERLPAWSRDLAAATLASFVLVGAVLLVGWSLLTTRFRRFALLAAGMLLSGAVSLVIGRLIHAVVDEPVQAAFAADVPLFRFDGGDGVLNPADPLLAAAVTTLVIGGSFVRTTLTRGAGAVVGLYTVATVATIGVPPLAVATDIGVGLLVGSSLLLLFGRHDLCLTGAEILGALARVGIDGTLERAPHGDGWVVIGDDEADLVVRDFSRDDRNADLALRLYRWARFRRTADHRPFVSLRRSVEHEALAWQQARARGVRTPAIVAVAPAGVDGMVLVREQVVGISAALVPELTDTVVDRIWRQVVALHRAGIAHGALHLGNVVIDSEAQPWLMGFDRAELAAAPARLDGDVVELLAASAVSVGSERAVRAAVRAFGPERIASVAPLIQPLALSSRTRDGLEDRCGTGELRAEVATACGVPAEEPVRLERVDAKTLFVVITIVVSGWVLVPQLTDLESIWTQVQGASWQWVLVALGCSIGTYLAATTSLLGAIPTRLRFWPALTAQVASSFANRITPAKVGGLATNIRYFQRQGVPVPVSVTAVGLNAIGGIAVHLALTLCFLLLASGSSESSGLRLPSAGAVALGASAGFVAAAGVLVVPTTRGLVKNRVVPQLRAGWNSIRAVAQDPGRLGRLLGGSTGITLFYMGAMLASLEAFGSTASLPTAGLLFLTGTAVANAAPTPGGLGAAEAALIAAFSTIEEAAVVVPAVFLFRLVTFWLPILPGWLALTYLRQTDRL